MLFSNKTILDRHNDIFYKHFGHTLRKLLRVQSVISVDGYHISVWWACFIVRKNGQFFFNLFIFYWNTNVKWKMLCYLDNLLYLSDRKVPFFCVENLISFGSVKINKSTTTQYQNKRFACGILQCIVESNYYFWQCRSPIISMDAYIDILFH